MLKEYRGSYLMAFAGYNAGRGRVAEWVAKHGDPRDPKVDAVNWIERIPFAETRNYVQRVMENLQVYCARFGASTATVEPNLHRAAPVGSHANPVPVEAIPLVRYLRLPVPDFSSSRYFANDSSARLCCTRCRAETRRELACFYHRRS